MFSLEQVVSGFMRKTEHGILKETRFCLGRKSSVESNFSQAGSLFQVLACLNKSLRKIYFYKTPDRAEPLAYAGGRQTWPILLHLSY
jgi:hypothetical protein